MCSVVPRFISHLILCFCSSKLRWSLGINLLLAIIHRKWNVYRSLKEGKCLLNVSCMPSHVMRLCSGCGCSLRCSIVIIKCLDSTLVSASFCGWLYVQIEIPSSHKAVQSKQRLAEACQLTGGLSFQWYHIARSRPEEEVQRNLLLTFCRIPRERDNTRIPHRLMLTMSGSSRTLGVLKDVVQSKPTEVQAL